MLQERGPRRNLLSTFYWDQPTTGLSCTMPTFTTILGVVLLCTNWVNITISNNIVLLNKPWRYLIVSYLSLLVYNYLVHRKVAPQCIGLNLWHRLLLNFWDFAFAWAIRHLTSWMHLSSWSHWLVSNWSNLAGWIILEYTVFCFFLQFPLLQSFCYCFDFLL